ncbi:MAG: tetratricopeptide repeat protein [Rubrivivax sp.]|nr:tetratricopeptide repeat protein [Rubrivivax sp.]
MSSSMIRFLLICFAMTYPASCGIYTEEQTYRKAQEYWEKDQYDLAAAAYEEFANRFPESEKASVCLFKAANLLAEYMQEYSRAVEVYLQLINEYPRSSYAEAARLNLAEIYEVHLKEYAKAIEQYGYLLESVKGSPAYQSKYLYRIGRNQFLMGDLDKALSTFRDIVTNDPAGGDSDRAAYQMGYIHYLQGKTFKAERDFRFFLDKFPNSSWTYDALVHLARCYEKNHKGIKARETYRKIRERYPDRNIHRDLQHLGKPDDTAKAERTKKARNKSKRNKLRGPGSS